MFAYKLVPIRQHAFLSEFERRGEWLVYLLERFVADFGLRMYVPQGHSKGRVEGCQGPWS